MEIVVPIVLLLAFFVAREMYLRACARAISEAMRERHNRVVEMAMQGLLAGGMWDRQSESSLAFDAKRVAAALIEEMDK